MTGSVCTAQSKWRWEDRQWRGGGWEEEEGMDGRIKPQPLLSSSFFFFCLPVAIFHLAAAPLMLSSG